LGPCEIASVVAPCTAVRSPLTDLAGSAHAGMPFCTLVAVSDGDAHADAPASARSWVLLLPPAAGPGSEYGGGAVLVVVVGGCGVSPPKRGRGGPTQPLPPLERAEVGARQLPPILPRPSAWPNTMACASLNCQVRSLASARFIQPPLWRSQWRQQHLSMKRGFNIFGNQGAVKRSRV
jgi:hypothetical protein